MSAQVYPLQQYPRPILRGRTGESRSAYVEAQVRPLLRLAESRGVHVNFGRLLDDLLHFGPKVKERWAMDFYGRKEDNDDRIGA